MFRFLRYVLLIAVVLAGATAAAAYFVLQEPNRLRPEIESLIAARTGVAVRIDGDLDWRLWPPVSLRATALSAEQGGRHWQVGGVSLDLDARSLVTDPNGWRIQALTLNDVNVLEDGNRLNLERLTLADLSPGRDAPVSANLSYTPADGTPIPMRIDGRLQVNAEATSVSLRDARVATTDAEGVCNVELRALPDPAPAPPATAGDLLPLDLLLGYDGQGGCLLDWLQVDGQRFERVVVDLTNSAGDGRARLTAPAFFGGAAELDLSVDAREGAPRWRLVPTFREVNSQALLTWLEQRLVWAAPLAYGGELTFQGNSRDAMLATLSGTTRFDGGQGTIDITAVKAEVRKMAESFNEGERIARWPDIWAYQRLVGDWRVDGTRHVVDATLDNLAVAAQGDYDPVGDEMDMAVTLTFGNDPSLPVFELNPLLYDLPIPLRCRGTLAEPACRLDSDGARSLLARAMAGGEDNELRATLDRKIDEQVPEQYRDAARALLEMLGGGSAPPPEQ